MYYPVPGYTHMMVHLPDAPARDSSATRDEPAPPGASATPVLSPLVQVALDAAFGLRDVKILQERAFAPGVRAHVRARRRGRREPAGTARIVTCHSSPGTDGSIEFCGTVISNNRHYGWVARVEGKRLAAFRVL